MKKEALLRLLEGVQAREVSVESAIARLQTLPFEDLGYARVDHHRALRAGLPEVIYCPGKTPEQVVRVFRALAARSRPVLATRAGEDVYGRIRAEVPEASYDEMARMVFLPDPELVQEGLVVVVSAGTADLPIAQEAARTAALMGARVETLWDVGIAGMHRIVPELELLREARVIVVAAGMEGALPSVVAGLVSRPVIAVPTSIGYGAALSGITPLLAMLTSCAAGVSVVNIDNGFGGGYIAALINRGVPEGHTPP